MSDQIRVEIGFEGGALISALVSVTDADRLAGELAGGASGVVALEASDGQLTVNLAHVAYVKRFARESRVGFGGS